MRQNIAYLGILLLALLVSQASWANFCYKERPEQQPSGRLLVPQSSWANPGTQSWLDNQVAAANQKLGQLGIKARIMGISAWEIDQIIHPGKKAAKIRAVEEQFRQVRYAMAHLAKERRPSINHSIVTISIEENGLYPGTWLDKARKIQRVCYDLRWKWGKYSVRSCDWQYIVNNLTYQLDNNG